MKHINESIIGRRGTLEWPNPYGLTKKDAKGELDDVPLEIITLILKEMESQGKTDCLYKAQKYGLSSNIVLNWDKTKDGSDFWCAIWYDIWYNGKYSVFYDRYTPQKLKERIEE